MPATKVQLRRYPELDGKTFLVGVGANKCATSWVYTYLQTLSGVTASPLKEVHFFNARFHENAAAMDLFAVKRLVFHIRQGGDVVGKLRDQASFQASLERVKMIYDDNAYFDHFARIVTLETKTLCDITPAYSGIGQSGFEYMKEFFATQDVALKVLYIMRDPVERLWSHIRYRVQSDPDKDVLKAWPEMIEDPELMGWTDYRGTVEALDAVLPEQDLLYLFYEDLFSEAALIRLCSFIDAVHVPPDAGQAVNETELKVELPGDVREQLRAMLAPQYVYCRQRFGGQVPALWQA